MRAIFDLGMSEGNDTAYYLAKGFKVIGVEADRDIYEHLKTRFAEAVDAGDLIMMNRAASDTSDKEVPFYKHAEHQGVSGLQMNKDLHPDGYLSPYVIKTINWHDLAKLAKPYYVKIDIENCELQFLRGMVGSDFLPEFMSVECHTLDPVFALAALGYERFRLVDQNSAGGFELAEKQLEGRQVDKPNFLHASGPFGLDVFEKGWADLRQFENLWNEAQPNRVRTWYDCHAWQPAFASPRHRKSDAGLFKPTLKKLRQALGL